MTLLIFNLAAALAFASSVSFPWLSSHCGLFAMGDLAESAQEARHGSPVTVPLLVAVFSLDLAMLSDIRESDQLQ